MAQWLFVCSALMLMSNCLLSDSTVHCVWLASTRLRGCSTLFSVLPSSQCHMSNYITITTRTVWHVVPVGINVKEREREMEQVTAVGKRTTFFLLLVLAASASATSLNTTQQNTAITATSDKQVKRAWGVCARAQDSWHFKSMWEHLRCTSYNRILSFYFLP